MSRTLIRPIGIALAIACAGFIVPHTAFAQEGSSHDASHVNTVPAASMYGNHHGDGVYGNHEASPSPATDHSQVSSQQHDASAGTGHGHAPAGDSPRSAEKAKADSTSTVEHGAAHGMPSDGKEDVASDSKGRSAVTGTKPDSEPKMRMGRMQGGKAPPDARDPDVYAEGTKRQPMHGMEMADDELFGSISVNELEYVDSRRGGHGQSLDMEAWYGGDYNKLWFKAESERRKGHLESMRTEVLWDRVFATFWSTQIGIRHDTGEGGSTRDWLAFGVRGLAPYWVHMDATAYAGTHGAFAARAEASYDLLLTQRLVLQPKIEASLYSKNDASRGIGSGLSEVELGLRLRYEIRRQFAPYIGVNWKRLYGNTADYAREAGEKASDTEYVAGVRFWF